MRASKGKRAMLKVSVALVMELLIMSYIKSLGIVTLLGLFVVAGNIVKSNPYATVGVVSLSALTLIIGVSWVVLFLVRHSHTHIAAIQHNRLDLAIKQATLHTMLESHQAAMRTQSLLHFDDGHMLVQHSDSSVNVLYRPTQQLPSVRVSEVASEQLMIEAPMPKPLDLIQYNDTGEVIVGVDKQGNAVTRPYSNVFVTGITGKGKTSTMVWHVSQAVMRGASLAVLDPHQAASDDSLYAAIRPYEASFAYPVGGDVESMLSVVRSVKAELDSRMGGSGVTRPILIVVDELNQIMTGLNSAKDTTEYALAKELKELLYLTNVAARKFGIKAIAAAQDVSAAALGGSTSIRETFSMRLYHALRNRQAQMLDVSEYKDTLKALRTGEVLMDFISDVEMEQLRVPYMSSADVERVALMSR